MGKLGFLYNYRYVVTPNTVYIGNCFDGVRSQTPQNIEQFWQQFPEEFKGEK